MTECINEDCNNKRHRRGYCKLCWANGHQFQPPVKLEPEAPIPHQPDTRNKQKNFISKGR